MKLSYPENLLDAYQRLSHLPGFVLLQTSQGHFGRYDIVSAYPTEIVTYDKGGMTIDQFFNKLKRKPINTSQEPYPFQGGWIGFLSYEALHQELHLEQHQMPNPFEPLPVAEAGYYEWAIIIDHKHKSADWVCPFQRSDLDGVFIKIRDLWENKHASIPEFSITGPLTALMSDEAYQRAFTQIQTKLKNGELYQVNLTLPFMADYKGNEFSIYSQIQNNNPVPYSAYLKGTQSNILSFSPERFLEIESGRVLTSPIKGTTKRSNNVDDDLKLAITLQSSVKNRAENVMIVDLMRNDLGQLAIPGTVCVDELCEIQSFKGIHHLVSHIQAQLPLTLHPLDIFRACFPGGSITGAPKRAAMQCINHVEPYRRGVYCGSIFYLSSHGRFDSNIAIRTLLARKQKLLVNAGGGIVINSNMQDELQEAHQKIYAIMKALNSL